VSLVSERVIRGLVVLALVVDAVIHLRLAPQMEIAAPGGLGGGWIFRLQAIAALLVAAYLLLRGSRLAYLIAAVVLVSVFGAVLTYAFIDLPAIGPIPPMYDPLWYPEKVLSAVVEGLGAALAILGWWVSGRSPAVEPATVAQRG
jgi:hypothetical protein